MNREVAWTMMDEIEFISRLTEQQLDGYLKGAERRTDWGEIDGARAIAYARGRRQELSAAHNHHAVSL